MKSPSKENSSQNSSWQILDRRRSPKVSVEKNLLENKNRPKKQNSFASRKNSDNKKKSSFSGWFRWGSASASAASDKDNNSEKARPTRPEIETAKAGSDEKAASGEKTSGSGESDPGYESDPANYNKQNGTPVISDANNSPITMQVFAPMRVRI